MSTFAIASSDIYTAAEQFSRSTGLTFQRRESDFRGLYCLFESPEDRGRVYIIENRDPLFRSELDPPEDETWEREFPPNQVLVEVEALRTADFELWEALIHGSFPNAIAVRIRRPAAG